MQPRLALAGSRPSESAERCHHLAACGFGVTDEAELSWYPEAFSLTLGTFILPAGRLGDVYGHKNMYMLDFCGTPSGRSFQGIGCALLVPNALAIVGKTYGASPKKNMVFALFGAAAPTGWVAGAVFSSILAQLGWWPWAFFALAITCIFYKDFDALGRATGVSGLVLFNFAWNQAAVVGWSTVYTYVLLIVGILLLAAFAVVEIKISLYPLVPLRGFKGEAALALGVIAAGWGSFGIWVFYLWRLIENLLSGLLAAVTTGFLLSCVKVPYVLLLATLFFLTGQILIATVPVEQTYFVSIIVMPWSMDLSFPSGTIILSKGTPAHDQWIAASLINTTVNHSISLGLGIARTIIRDVSESGGSTLDGYRGAWYFGIG
ncbi:uncharacterized protein LTR77_003328 [Saxophila tyrrhenica]|uniref:MFS general substrate transporter n=1 Tax=Saxophila tyrrhenica TaxID=1690608 RepID=A0AAV9PI13_9PEZI|nr:hypothetical protein LTR77_003328 [Saxophila tyrrhenica]